MVEHAFTVHGATLHQETVERLLVQDDKVVGVVTSSGNITADHVILAAGLGTVELSASLDITVPVNSRLGLIVHSKPVATRLLNGLAISNGPHMRQTVEGRVIAGRHYSGGNPTTDPAAGAEIFFKKVQAMFRSDLDGAPLPSLELDFYTVGIRPDPKDGLPILGDSGKQGLDTGRHALGCDTGCLCWSDDRGACGHGYQGQGTGPVLPVPL